ncbi:MAG: ATP-dependent RecD-like DNA helicase [Firmicutes bacterium]|nr:ATP-dependent RecD-like DNA helicase [Bacillota bacterium]
MPEQLTGLVTKIAFHNPETGFLVLRAENESEGEFVAVGNSPLLTEGNTYTFLGEWVDHPRFGPQFKFTQAELQLPASTEGIVNYLASGLFPGVGMATAKRLVGVFGEETLKVIAEEPHRLEEVPGIGPAKAKAIAEAYSSQVQGEEAFLFLYGLGLSGGLVAKLYNHYGDSVQEVISVNPYRAAEEVEGIGFKTADKIAAHLGLPSDSPERLRAGLFYTLERAAEEGHLYLPESELLSTCSDLLGVEPERLATVLADLAQEFSLAYDYDDAGESLYYLPSLYFAERGSAGRLVSLLFAKSDPVSVDVARVVGDFEAELGFPLAPEQTQAIKASLDEKVLIITGGPGTGKTTIIRGIIQLLEGAGLQLALAAPTGRASKRLEETCYREAKTIHRLLEYAYTEQEGMVFGRNEDNPLTVDALIVDEVSMLDLPLFYSLLKALKPGTRLILVGDEDQLPSVGPGNVLRDLIASKVVPVVKLNKIFRQGETSQIVVNAHRINQGLLPETKGRGGDFFHLREADPRRVEALIKELVTERIPKTYQVDATTDIQVLSPMRRGIAGVDNLNNVLRDALNPPGPLKAELTVGSKSFRTGDKVMQTKNNYQKNVFNGDIGRITAINRESGEVVVTFADQQREVVYIRSETEELTLAYCISVHKSQGSEYPVVIFPLLTQHYVMLQRNLLYTAITRGRDLVILIGPDKALSLAVNNNRTVGRNSRLQKLLAKKARKWRVVAEETGMAQPTLTSY